MLWRTDILNGLPSAEAPPRTSIHPVEVDKSLGDRRWISVIEVAKRQKLSFG
jgi:hypothetical protein